MNDHSIIPPPHPGGRGTWLDAYMPDAQLTHYQQQQQFLNMAAIRGILFRQRWLILAALMFSAVAGLIVTLLATPMYVAQATVRIEPYGTFIVQGQDVDQGVASNQVYDMLSTQIGVITSRSLANTVAENLQLGERSDFLGADIDESRPPNLTDREWVEAKQKLAAAILHGSVSAELPDNNWILAIRYRSSDPVIAAEMANAYSAAFAATETKDSLDSNEYAQSYLKEQIELTRQRLQEAEEAANVYARSSGIIVQPGGEEDGTSATLTSTNLSSINQRVAAARAARIEAEQRWRSIRSLPAAQLPEVQNNPVLQTLVADRTAKQAQLADLRERYNDGFPQIATLLAQIRTLDTQIERSSADIKATVRNQFVVAQNQEQALQRELSTLTGETLAEQDLQVQYGVLEREAQALREQLQALLSRFNQVSTAANVKTGMINPLDPAIVPGSPYEPSLIKNLGLGLVFGVALAAALAVLRETLDDRVRSFEEVEEKIGLPLLGHTPFVDENDILADESNRFSALMEAYASIRSTIDFAMPRDQNVLQLTSSQASAGKSTTAVILAELFASLGRKTLLIDGDLRRPSVPRLLDIERPKVGLVEVLLGHVDLQSAVIRGVHENLEILPVGEIPANPTEIFASSQLRDFIAQYRHEYSLILIDTSPILGLADAPMLARLVDGTIFVMEANRVNFGQVRTAIKRLRSSGGNPIGAILTKYRALEAGQAYNYQYGYYEYETAR